MAEAAPGPQVEGGDGQDVVAVDEAAPLVDGHEAVGVAVEGQACGRPGGHHLGLERPGVGRPAAGVDVGAGGRGADGEVLDLGPQLGQHPGGGDGGSAVPAVDHDP